MAGSSSAVVVAAPDPEISRLLGSGARISRIADCKQQSAFYCNLVNERHGIYRRTLSLIGVLNSTSICSNTLVRRFAGHLLSDSS